MKIIFIGWKSGLKLSKELQSLAVSLLCGYRFIWYLVDEMRYFVWIAGVAGPEPQVWAEMQVDGSGKYKPYLACHAIADDDHRTLGELRRDFKYEQPAQ